MNLKDLVLMMIVSAIAAVVTVSILARNDRVDQFEEWAAGKPCIVCEEAGN